MYRIWLKEQHQQIIPQQRTYFFFTFVGKQRVKTNKGIDSIQQTKENQFLPFKIHFISIISLYQHTTRTYQSQKRKQNQQQNLAYKNTIQDQNNQEITFCVQGTEGFSEISRGRGKKGCAGSSSRCVYFFLADSISFIRGLFSIYRKEFRADMINHGINCLNLRRWKEATRSQIRPGNRQPF